jgi:hypothetical protein
MADVGHGSSLALRLKRVSPAAMASESDRNALQRADHYAKRQPRLAKRSRIGKPDAPTVSARTRRVA